MSACFGADGLPIQWSETRPNLRARLVDEIPNERTLGGTPPNQSLWIQFQETMIDREKDVVEWALLGRGLHEAREHLDSLIRDMESPEFDEVSFGCQLSHIYAHLNQAWNGRAKTGQWAEADYNTFRQYPCDLRPDEGWPPDQNG